MSWLLRRTLVRRVVGALLLAFGLAWLAVSVYMYLDVRASLQTNSALLVAGGALNDALVPVEGKDLARNVVQTSGDVFNGIRAKSGVLLGRLLYQLRDRNGVLVYSSPEIADVQPVGAPGQVVERSLAGKDYWLYQGQSPHWTLWMAEPRVDTPWILNWIGNSLLVPFLVAFPFLLLPVWIAASQGLKPLRTLAARIGQRNPDDLSPLGYVPRHAEMVPLVGAMEGLLTQLRTRVQRERSFVQDAAHELRTPLAVVTAQAHVLLRATQPADQQAAAVQLQHAIDRSAHLVQQLLELARMDEVQHPVAEVCDLAAVARRHIAQAAVFAGSAGIELELDAPDEVPFCLVPPLFETVLRNLLDNAIKYVGSGGHVVVSLRMDGNQVALGVGDNGPGIAANEQERVFERFYRGSTAQDQGGTGLGLAIVQQACLQMKAAVGLRDNTDGKGCLFTVCIPRQAAS